MLAGMNGARIETLDEIVFYRVVRHGCPVLLRKKFRKSIGVMSPRNWP